LNIIASPSLGSAVTGHGGTMNFTDTSTNPARFNSITAH
jgi:hypothetical protein